MKEKPVPEKLIQLLQEIRNNLKIEEKIVSRAIEIYKEARKKYALIGFSLPEMASGLIYIASLQENKPIPLYKISKITNIKTRIIWSVAATLNKNQIIGKVARVPDFVHLIKEKIINILPQKEFNEVIEIISKNIDNIKRKVGSASPRAIAGSILWILKKKKRISKKFSQKELAKLFETNEVSIRLVSKKLKDLNI